MAVKQKKRIPVYCHSARSSAMTNSIIVFVTTASIQEAEKIAQHLVKQRLAACGNIIPEIRSIYWWQDKLETGQEALLILKSRAAFFTDLEREIKAQHSYVTPEIIALPIVAGSEDYLKWIETETHAKQE
jgi:periplasmic divalent cation tolerance protein